MNKDKTYKFIAPESNEVHAKNSTADKTLKESIKYNGILTPLIVTRYGSDEYKVIDGVRRLKIAKELGLESIPYYLKTEDDFKPYKSANGKDSDNDRSDSEDEHSIEVKADYAKWSINLANGKINHEELVSMVKQLREKGMGYGAIAQRIGYSRSGVRKIIASFEKSSDKSSDSESEKKSKRFKSLVTTLDNIKKSIPDNQHNYIRAFDMVKEYLRKQIDAK